MANPTRFIMREYKGIITKPFLNGQSPLFPDRLRIATGARRMYRCESAGAMVRWISAATIVIKDTKINPELILVLNTYLPRYVNFYDRSAKKTMPLSKLVLFVLVRVGRK